MRELVLVLAPIYRDSILFDEAVALGAVALDGDGNEGGVNDLAAGHLHTQLQQRLVEACKQIVNDSSILERSAERPHSAGIRYVTREQDTEKTHEGEAVSDLVFELFVGKPILGLQNQHLEHEHTVGGFAPSVVLLRFVANAVKQGAKQLPINGKGKPLQWVANLAEVGVAVVKVKEAGLHGGVSGRLCLNYQVIMGVKGTRTRGIYRSALKSDLIQ